MTSTRPIPPCVAQQIAHLEDEGGFLDRVAKSAAILSRVPPLTTPDPVIPELVVYAVAGEHGGEVLTLHDAGEGRVAISIGGPGEDGPRVTLARSKAARLASRIVSLLE